MFNSLIASVRHARHVGRLKKRTSGLPTDPPCCREVPLPQSRAESNRPQAARLLPRYRGRARSRLASILATAPESLRRSACSRPTWPPRHRPEGDRHRHSLASPPGPHQRSQDRRRRARIPQRRDEGAGAVPGWRTWRCGSSAGDVPQARPACKQLRAFR